MTSQWFRLVIVTACAGVHFLTWGSLYSAGGVLFASWTRDMGEEGEALLSLVGALPSAIGCIAGPIFGMVIERCGYRLAALLGGALASVGWTASAMMDTPLGLTLTFGVLLGFGSGLVNFACCSALNDYFVEDRILGEGVCGSSVCLGLFVFTKLLQLLIHHYTWKGALLMMGAVHLHLQDCADFFQRSTSFPTTTVTDSSDKLGAKSGGRSAKEFVVASVELWRRLPFILLFLSDTLYWTAAYIPYIHLVERARQLDADDETSTWISSCNGLGGLFGRFAFSYIFHKSKTHPLHAYGILQFSCGVFTLLSTLWSTVPGLIVYAVMFGAFSGGYGALKASVAILLGKQHYVISFSWFLFIEGIGIVVGPTIGGMLYARTGKFTCTFLFSGSVFVVSAVPALFKNLLLRQNSSHTRYGDVITTVA